MIVDHFPMSPGRITRLPPACGDFNGNGYNWLLLQNTFDRIVRWLTDSLAHPPSGLTISEGGLSDWRVH